MLKSTLIIIGVIIFFVIAIEVTRLIRLHSQVATYQDYWHNNANQTGQIIYVAMGDSAAQGIGASQPTNGYVGRLAERIAAAQGKTVRVVNISETGAKLKDIINSQLPEMVKYQPAIVTLDIGGNDIKQFDAKKYEVEMSEIMSRLPKGTYISDVPYFTTRFWNNSKVNEANQIFYRLSKSHDLQLVPLHIYTKEQISRWHDFAADWFHPNDRGYHVWADAFWSNIGNNNNLQSD
jgi:acyl-CoA thioesterase I